MLDPSRHPRFGSCFVAALCLISALGRAQERVTIPTKDGYALIGTFIKPPTAPPEGGVVLLPMAKGTRVSFDPILPRLAQAGLAAVVIEPRYDAGVESAPSRPLDGGPAGRDVDAALDLLVQRGAPVGRLAIAGAGSGASLALEHAARTGMRVKALALMSPGRDGPIPTKEELKDVASRPVLVIATADEAAKGATTLKEVMPGAELQMLEDRVASGTSMFGRVTGIESTIADWIDRALAQPTAIDIPESKLIFNDGELSPGEVPGATRIEVPLGNGSSATIRLSHSKRTLDVGFDIPEPYVRLNEVAIYVDSSGKGSRMLDASCYRVSYNPKNPARKPLLVQRGGLKGFEDSDDKGVVAHAHTEMKRRWTAEVSLDLSRFIPGDFPKSARLAFQINGQRTSDVRFFPDDAKVPTSPGAWSIANLR